MQEQQYELKNMLSFNAKHIFECGECFRWDEESDGSYTGIVGKNVISVKQVENRVKFSSYGADNLEKLVTNYFDLTRNYEEIKDKLSKIDKHLAKSIEYGSGIRILNQDLWETIISFIISANNNIPRIKGIINRISKNCAEKAE